MGVSPLSRQPIFFFIENFTHKDVLNILDTYYRNWLAARTTIF